MPVFPIEILCYPADALTRREICCFPAKTWDKYGIISEIPRVFFLVSHLELLVAVLREKIREISKENMTTKNVTDMMILQEITMDFIPENPELFQLTSHNDALSVSQHPKPFRPDCSEKFKSSQTNIRSCPNAVDISQTAPYNFLFL